MSVGPRVVFTRFVTRDSPKLTPWTAHRDRLIGRAGASVAGSSLDHDVAIVWQLVSGNNRQLGRGADVHGSFESAAETARSVVESAGDLTLAAVSEAGRGLYGWYAVLEGTPVMTCARWYTTERDRHQSGALALSAIARAELAVGTRLMDPALMREGSR